MGANDPGEEMMTAVDQAFETIEQKIGSTKCERQIDAIRLARFSAIVQDAKTILSGGTTYTAVGF
jgi:hypothetical protein